MAKPKSSDLVDDNADAVRRFEAIEARTEKTEGLLEAIAKKLGIGEEPEPTPKPNSKPKSKDEPEPAPKVESSGIEKLLRDVGILKKDVAPASNQNGD